MINSEARICNLLFRYGEALDSGDLQGASGLFAQARLKFPGLDDELFGSEPLLQSFRDNVRIYEDGTPRTKHVITNPIVEVDEAAGTATCRSYYTVQQGFPGNEIKIVCSGRYYDEFTRIENDWHFSYRDYSMMDLVGDMSNHMLDPSQF